MIAKPTRYLTRLLAVLCALLNPLAPFGYEDDAGFHLVKDQSS